MRTIKVTHDEMDRLLRLQDEANMMIFSFDHRPLSVRHVAEILGDRAPQPYEMVRLQVVVREPEETPC